MDITLTIFIEPPSRNALADDAHKWYRNGDIISVDLFTSLVTVSNPRFALIHIYNIPDKYSTDIQLEKLRNFLLSNIYRIELGKAQTIRKRKWHVPLNLLPINIYNDLLNQKFIEVSWNQVKSYIRSKTVINDYDINQDSNTVELSDGDL